tara:strand:- start:12419 stop:13306 length:888 start_codon:yes stop_codon:yes gene_type:complete
MSTKKVKNRRERKKKKLTKKVYGADRMQPYSIHKSTMISFDPIKSCKQLIYIFNNAISDIQSPPDPALKKRGIKWVRFKRGGKAEFHFVPPYSLNHDKMLRSIVDEEKNISPLESQFLENHVGIYVPDLTDVVIKCLKKNIKCILNKRDDGMYQFYIAIDGCLDYLDVDSVKLDINKIKKLYPDFRVYTFKQNTKKQLKLQEKIKKNKHSEKIKIYSDPNHKNMSRTVIYHKDQTVTVTGKDSIDGKPWIIKGSINKNNTITLDFTSKGGPKNITGKVSDKKITFSDGNIWTVIL